MVHTYTSGCMAIAFEQRMLPRYVSDSDLIPVPGLQSLDVGNSHESRLTSRIFRPRGLACTQGGSDY